MTGKPVTFTGAEGNAIAADLYTGEGRTVIFLHGGGQTRHAWGGTARRVAAAGARAISVDLRGHGQSAWVDSGNYRFADYVADTAELGKQALERFGDPVVIAGASLGGIAALGAEQFHGPLAESLILVDITPRMDLHGVLRIQGFMAEHLNEGFANLDEAADAIARYLPNRKRPSSLAGLAKNLRLGADGRHYWHWDPLFMTGERNINAGALEILGQMMDALPKLDVPVLLVRGMQSELIHPHHAEEFLALAPKARLVDVSEAGHMVAGDRNDVFTKAVLGFLGEVRG